MTDEVPKPAVKTWVDGKRKREDAPAGKNNRPYFQGGKGKHIALPSTPTIPACP
ncbi:CDP-alcohol phosphatidyltransferase family protein [Sesbania bispinosa]|nr:CDP-alcohol phosphatidyltransferase family protein [Sesbania bispinosa]